MAAVDPRIVAFNESAREALAAVRRANLEAKALEGELATARATTGSLGAEAGVGRVGAAETTEVSTARVAALSKEEQVLARVTKARGEGTVALEAEIKAMQAAATEADVLVARYGPFAGGRFAAKESASMVSQMGPYAGGRAAYNRFGYMGAGYGGPPPIPPGGKLPPEGGFPALMAPAGKPSTVTAGIAEEEQQYIAARAAADQYRNSVNSLVTSQNAASVAMRRHGAMTTEFITAAGRGQVTLRELGYQVSQTTAKFGGWILAGTALYGAAAAMGKVFHGALDTASGVQQLKRVIDNLDVASASKEIRELSEHFNLPIGTVTEAAFGMGKAFHDQADALMATKAALYAIKIGELDAGTATKYLISIVNGFHLPASQMGTLFDELLKAQKRYAIDLPTLMAGVGKAGGAFRAAGGDVHGLISLITLLQHVSGQSGQAIGTALLRSPHFIAMPENQKKLEGFGLNPKASIEVLYKEAIEAAQSQSGAKQREIAEALFGPQYGSRVGIFLLQNKKLYEEVFKTTLPGKAKGAAEEQLQIQLGRASERLTEIGVKLEGLGSALSRSEAFHAIEGLVGSLSVGLSLVTDMVEAFNRLPAPVKTALSTMLQLSLLLRGVRRFNLGGNFVGDNQQTAGARGFAAGFIGGGDRVEARKFTEALFAKRDFFVKEEAALHGKLLSVARRSDTYHAQYVSALEREKVLQVQAAAGTEQSVAALEQQQALTATLKGQWEAYAAQVRSLAIEEGYARDQLATTNASLAATTGRFGKLSPSKALEEKARVEAAEYGIVATGAKSAGTSAEEAGKAAEKVAPGAAEESFKAAETSFSRGALTMGALRSGAAELGATVSSFVGGIVNYGFIGVILFEAFDALYNWVNEEQKHWDQNLTKIETLPKSAQDLRALAQRHEAHGHGSFTKSVEGVFEKLGKEGVNVFNPFGPRAKDQAEEEKEAEELSIREAEDIEKVNRYRRHHGQPQLYRGASEIEHEAKAIEGRGLTRQQAARALDKLDEELGHSMEKLRPPEGAKAKQEAKEAQKKAEEAIAQARTAATGESLGELSEKVREKWLGAYESLIVGAGGTFNPSAFHTAAAILRINTNRLTRSTNPEDLAKVQEQQEQFYDTAFKAVEEEITDGIQLARTPRERHAVYRQALGRVQQIAGIAGQEQQHARKQLEQAQRKLQESQSKEQNVQENVEGPKIGRGALTIAGAPTKKALDQLQQQVKEESRHVKALSKTVREAHKRVELFEQKIEEQIYEQVSALREARVQYRVSKTADPMEQTKLELGRINDQLAAAIRIFGRNSQQVFQLLQQREDTLANQVKDELSLIRANAKYSAAGISPKNTVALAKAGVNELQRVLAFEHSHSSRFSPAEIKEVETELRSAEVQLAEDIREQAKSIKDAQYGIAIQRQENQGHPIHAINEEIRQARYDLSKAATPLERLEAQRQLISLAGKKRNAVAQVGLENIEFEADINKITTQQEITQLEQLLKDYKLTRDMRRQIREQIHGLKKDSGNYDLDVGSIQLPTIYDIRRAIQGGIGNNPASVSVTNSPQITVNNYSSDPNVVGKALGQVLNGHTTSALRSAGVKT